MASGPVQASSSPTPVVQDTYWEGPHGSHAECLVVRQEFHAIGWLVGHCTYRDLSGTADDGWYFKYAEPLLRPA
ncbi:hypothetical protein [Micromonospora echinospora]|uniref:hypothetical protein n=1 Tax=Micromonospora echinospora TaxID=1877 RepID=UPI003A8397C2